ncbi:MAG: SpoIIE family protein phosphatase [Blautia sp.]|jgi:hypothetical protein
MSYSVEISWKSLNKYHEELCGDKVEILHTEDSDIVILADGMGSGVKANILATLTSRILGVMLREGAKLADCVETVARTLPICRERNTAYATFSILQIFKDGRGYLAEYENPSCIFIRDRKLAKLPFKERFAADKRVREADFSVQENDCFILLSDGVIYAGAGELLNYGWTWECTADYALKCARESLSAARMAARLSDACQDLYEQRPGDDTTVAVARIQAAKVVSVLTGPPSEPSMDETIVREFIAGEGKKVICGGTTANLAARILKRKIVTETAYSRKDVPPAASMEGVDLITEGALTLSAVLPILEKFQAADFDVEFFQMLDEPFPHSRLARLLIEECTVLQLFVGTAVNTAHENKDLPFAISTRKNLVEHLKAVMEAMGKTVVILYY